MVSGLIYVVMGLLLALQMLMRRLRLRDLVDLDLGLDLEVRCRVDHAEHAQPGSHRVEVATELSGLIFVVNAVEERLDQMADFAERVIAPYRAARAR